MINRALKVNEINGKTIINWVPVSREYADNWNYIDYL